MSWSIRLLLNTHWSHWAILLFSVCVRELCEMLHRCLRTTILVFISRRSNCVAPQKHEKKSEREIYARIKFEWFICCIQFFWLIASIIRRLPIQLAMMGAIKHFGLRPIFQFNIWNAYFFAIVSNGLFFCWFVCCSLLFLMLLNSAGYFSCLRVWVYRGFHERAMRRAIAANQANPFLILKSISAVRRLDVNSKHLAILY